MKPADLLIENAAQVLTLKASKDAVAAEDKLAIVGPDTVAVAEGRIPPPPF